MRNKLKTNFKLMNSEDPYKILGLSRSATEQEIKKAYRGLSLKYHPDRNKSPEAEEMFKKVTRAQTLLLDKGKRAAYDRGGQRGLDEYEERSSYNEAMRTHNSIKQCEPIRVKMQLSLKDIYNGAKKHIKVKVTQESDSGAKVEEKTIPIDVNSNFEFGKTACLRGEGNSKPDHINGDILVDFVKEDDPSIDDFEISEFDLVLTKELTLSELIGGFKFPVRHPNGKTLIISGGPSDELEQTMAYENYGLPIPETVRTRARLRPTQTHGLLQVHTKFDLNSLKSMSPQERKALTTFLSQLKATKTPVYEIPDDAVAVTGTRVQGPQESMDSSGFFGIPGLPMGMGIPRGMGMGMPSGVHTVVHNNPVQCQQQ